MLSCPVHRALHCCPDTQPFAPCRLLARAGAGAEGSRTYPTYLSQDVARPEGMMAGGSHNNNSLVSAMLCCCMNMSCIAHVPRGEASAGARQGVSSSLHQKCTQLWLGAEPAASSASSRCTQAGREHPSHAASRVQQGSCQQGALEGHTQPATCICEASQLGGPQRPVALVVAPPRVGATGLHQQQQVLDRNLPHLNPHACCMEQRGS